MTRSLSRPVALSYELHVLLPCSTPPLRLARSPPAPPPGAGEGASGGCHPSRGLRMSCGAGGDLAGRRDVVTSAVVSCALHEPWHHLFREVGEGLLLLTGVRRPRARVPDLGAGVRPD